MMKAEEMSVFPMGGANEQFAKYFIGQSYLHMLSTEQAVIGNVTFEPGCRNYWHIHHADQGGGQLLLVTAGEGWYQEWGQKARRLKPGDVVHIPAGIKHWHGAIADSWFQHLAIEVAGVNCRNEWCEPVDDEAYGKLEEDNSEQACFGEVKKSFGFGCMRLPMKDGEPDREEICQMMDVFLENGFNYFDTAHGYLGGKSETALRDCLTSRYPREAYILTNKLSTHFFEKEEEIRPLFESQLAACGVDDFDFYLMHAQSVEIYEKFKRCRAYETALELKAEGKFKYFGISFHDKAAVLEQILTEYPQIEVVQLQFNYVDYDDASVESRKCYEVCRKFGKPVIVMEPVKGGSLVNLPEEAQAVLDQLGSGASNASYAIRFAAGFDGIMMVLSGMENMEMMQDNISCMKHFVPLSEEEKEAIGKVCEIFRAQDLIPCTACRYCTDGCPKQIAIPDLFACLNAKKQFQNWNTDYYYTSVHTREGSRASDCIKCGKCEHICPQHLPVRQLLDEVAAEFEK